MHLLCTACLLTAFSACSPRKAPHGIAAMTPSLTEAVLAFDDEVLKAHPLIASSRFTDDPRAAQAKKLDPGSMLEPLIAMNPELVLLHTSDKSLAEKLQTMGIRVIAHDMDTVDDIKRTMAEIGGILGVPSAAQTINLRLDEGLAENRCRYRSRRQSMLSALVIVDRLDARMQQFYIAQKPAYLVDLLYGCGVDALEPGTAPWERISAETLISLDPDAIVYFAYSAADAAETRELFTRMYGTLRAVKNGKLWIIGDRDLTVPGPDMARRQRKMCETLREAF